MNLGILRSNFRRVVVLKMVSLLVLLVGRNTLSNAECVPLVAMVGVRVVTM